MSCKIKEKKKWRKSIISDSESDENIRFTKIKNIYKCGICDKKIKNYCKCISTSNLNHTGYPGANIITIMTNPDNDNKPVQCQKGEKGDKGDRGLTGSMGLQGNSFIFFTSNNLIKSEDFIGVNCSYNDFNMASISIPYEFYVKQIGFVLKNQIKSKCTINLHINNKPTDYVVCICDGTVTSKSFNSVIKIKPTDLFCFKISYEQDTLITGITITLVIN